MKYPRIAEDKSQLVQFAEEVESGQGDIEKTQTMIADEYDATSTYSKGDVVIHDSELYEAKANISPAEEWNPEHWQKTNVQGLIQSQITDVIERSY